MRTTSRVESDMCDKGFQPVKLTASIITITPTTTPPKTTTIQIKTRTKSNKTKLTACLPGYSYVYVSS